MTIFALPIHEDALVTASTMTTTDLTAEIVMMTTSAGAEMMMEMTEDTLISRMIR